MFTSIGSLILVYNDNVMRNQLNVGDAVEFTDEYLNRPEFVIDGVTLKSRIGAHRGIITDIGILGITIRWDNYPTCASYTDPSEFQLSTYDAYVRERSQTKQEKRKVCN